MFCVLDGLESAIQLLVILLLDDGLKAMSWQMSVLLVCCASIVLFIGIIADHLNSFVLTSMTRKSIVSGSNQSLTVCSLGSPGAVILLPYTGAVCL